MQRNRSARTAWLTIEALYQSYSTGNELLIMMLNIGMLLKWYIHLVSHLKPFQKIFGDRRQIEFTSLSLFHIQQGEKDAETQSQ